MPKHLLDPEAFQAWKAQPQTQEFLQFLADRQADLMLAWGQGVSLMPEHQAQAVLLGQLADLSFEMIVAQYTSDDEVPEETDDAE